MAITRERARQIYPSLLVGAGEGGCETPEERAEINAFWETLPGFYTYAGAVQCMIEGDHLPSPPTYQVVDVETGQDVFGAPVKRHNRVMSWLTDIVEGKLPRDLEVGEECVIRAATTPSVHTQTTKDYRIRRVS